MKTLSLIVAGVAAFLLMLPSVAFSQASPKPSAGAPAKTTPPNRVEQRIQTLHAQLKITDAEESLWAAVAQVMRDNAQAVEALARERHEKTTMTAVDDLRSYQAIADAHATGLAKLVPAFQALYAAMPPDQQKNADTLFAKMKRRPATKK